MANILTTITTDQLRRAVVIREKIEELNAALDLLTNPEPAPTVATARRIAEAHTSAKVFSVTPAFKAVEAAVTERETGKKIHWAQTAKGRAKLARAMRKSWRTGALAQSRA